MYRNEELTRALSIRDLTDPAQGPHAIQLMVQLVIDALPAEVRLVRMHPVVPVENNYERLGYPADAITRDARYTRYVSETCMLRSHTTAMIPPAVRDLDDREVVLACPGMVYRRDTVDRLHTGTPHQMDLWHVGGHDLDAMIEAVVHAALPGAAYRTVPARHPYTTQGRQIDVLVDGNWVEIGECGHIARHVLDRPGLAMGIGLDRLVMLRKGIPDIRLLRETDPRVAGQMLDLAPYRAVSRHPAISRDLSVAVDAEADVETLGDVVRQVAGDLAEEISILSETAVEDLPQQAVARLGALAGQKNVLLRLVLRAPARTLSDHEANIVRDRVYAAVHQGLRATPAITPTGSW